MRGFRKQSEKYFRDWIFEFYWAYPSLASLAKADESNTVPDITRRMGWLSNYFGTYLYTHGESPEQVRGVSPYAVVFLSLCLHFLRTSAERSDEMTFDKVAEHLRQFLKRELEDNGIKGCLDAYRATDRKNVHPEMPPIYATEKESRLARNELYDYKNLVSVIAAAWLMHKVKGNELQPEKVARFMEKLVAAACDFRCLLDLYAMPGMADRTTNRDNPLGFDGRDWASSPYSQSKCPTAFQRWIQPFYQFLLLKKAAESPPAGIDLRDIHQTQGADHESLKEFLMQVADDQYALPPECQGVSWGMAEEDFKSAKTRIRELVTSWSDASGVAPSGDSA
jgi:hypothetical protein